MAASRSAASVRYETITSYEGLHVSAICRIVPHETPQTTVDQKYIQMTEMFLFEEYSPLTVRTFIGPILRLKHYCSETSVFYGRVVPLIFNRHHPAWSNGRVYGRVMIHAGELINFFHAHRLQWCLTPDDAMYWSSNCTGQNSVVDLTPTKELQRLVKCGLYHENYGCDHKARRLNGTCN